MAAISFQEGLRQLSFTIRNWLNSNAIVNKSLLPNNIELNKVIQSGFYFLNSDNTYYDAPLTSKAGALLWVMQDSDKKATDLYQFYLDKNSMQLYMRTKIEENEFDAWRLIKANNEIIGISTEDLENYKAQILKEVANGYIDSNSYITNKQEQEEKIQSLDKKFEDYATTNQLEDLEQLILSMIVQLNQELNENYFNKEEIIKLLNSLTPGGQGGSGIPQIDINTDTDLNALIDTGIYFLGGDGKYFHHPLETNQACLLLVYASKLLPSFRTYQILINYHNKSLYIRNIQGLIKDGSFDYEINQPVDIDNWSAWKILSDLDPLKIGELKAELNAMSKDEFLIPVEGNLFDNNFIGGYRISGPRNKTDEDDLDEEFQDNNRYSFQAVEGFKGTAIIKINPNTSYWIGMDRVIRERRPVHEAPDDEKLYSYFALATATKALKVGDNFDGDIFRKSPGESIIGHIITAGPNDKYLYVQTCRGEVAPYLEVVQINLNSLPIELERANKKVYNNINKKETDQGFYILETDNWKTLTSLGDYNSVIYKFSDKINLAKEPEIIKLNNKIDSAITNSLSIEIQNNAKNLFDGNFISYTKNYRISGANISSMSRDKTALNNPIALIPVTIGKKYHIYISPRGQEFSAVDKSSGKITYAYFTKIGASNFTKEQIERKVDLGESKISLGHVVNLVSNNFAFTDLYIEIQNTYNINKDSTQPLIPQTLVIQTTGDLNTPFLFVEEIDTFPVGDEITKIDEHIVYSTELRPNTNDNSYGTININYGRTNYQLKHEQNIGKGTNTWRWWEHKIDEAKLFTSSDCEGPIRIDNVNEDGSFSEQADYIGGYHGNEIMESVSLFVDGQKIDLNKNQKIDNCKKISMIIESNCYHSHKHLYKVSSIKDNEDNTLTVTYLENDINAPANGETIVTINKTQIDTGDPQLKTIIGYSGNNLIVNYSREDCLFHRVKNLTFVDDKINIKNYWKYTGPSDKYAFKLGAYTGLYSILFKYLNGITTNYTNKLYTIPFEDEKTKSPNDTILLENSKYLTEVNFLGKSFDINIKSLRGQGEYYQGTVKNMLPDSGARYKAYFFDYGSKNNNLPLLKPADEFIGEFEIETKAPSEYYLNVDGTVNTL